ncbi:MAG: peptidylprolyl isomerase [Acetobacteraceae bacterium]
MSLFAAFNARASARRLAGALLALPLLYGAVQAQGGAAPPADPVVAKVDGQPIMLSDVRAAMAGLPEAARNLPMQTIYPLLLDQIIGGRALVAEAKKSGADKDPEVQRQVKQAADRALENALLQREVAPQVTDAMVRARYDRDIAGKPGEEEVRARHILVADEATAKTIIAELKKGGDFVALSTKYSKDPGSAKQGGDLGFFKKDQMVPEFAAAAFSLKDNEISPVPVKTQFGWHVIQVTGHRQAQPQGFEEARDELRQEMIQEGVQKAMARARAAVTIETFNIDGSSKRATDSAEPPPSR